VMAWAKHSDSYRCRSNLQWPAFHLPRELSCWKYASPSPDRGAQSMFGSGQDARNRHSSVITRISFGQSAVKGRA